MSERLLNEETKLTNAVEGEIGDDDAEKVAGGIRFRQENFFTCPKCVGSYPDSMGQSVNLRGSGYMRICSTCYGKLTPDEISPIV